MQLLNKIEWKDYGKSNNINRPISRGAKLSNKLEKHLFPKLFEANHHY